MDRNTAEMIRRAEGSLNYKRLESIEEDAIDRAMSGYKLTTAMIMELEEKYPELMRKLDEEYWKAREAERLED